MSLPLDVTTLPSLDFDPAHETDISPPHEAGRRTATLLRVSPNLAEADDQRLMLLIGAGNNDAFAVFCRRHAARCLSIAYHLLRNQADAEEVVQDAYLRVWRHAGRWRNTQARVTTWLYRVVVNLSLDQMRRATRFSVSIEHAAEAIAADPSPEAVVGQRELARVIARAVAGLPPRQRAALSLVIGEGLDCAEAAKVMQVTVGTMESLLVRGRRQLRAVLAEAGEMRTVPARSAKK